MKAYTVEWVEATHRRVPKSRLPGYQEECRECHRDWPCPAIRAAEARRAAPADQFGPDAELTTGELGLWPWNDLTPTEATAEWRAG